jgi:hypothetical protein
VSPTVAVTFHTVPAISAFTSMIAITAPIFQIDFVTQTAPTTVRACHPCTSLAIALAITWALAWAKSAIAHYPLVIGAQRMLAGVVVRLE